MSEIFLLNLYNNTNVILDQLSIIKEHHLLNEESISFFDYFRYF